MAYRVLLTVTVSSVTDVESMEFYVLGVVQIEPRVGGSDLYLTVPNTYEGCACFVYTDGPFEEISDHWINAQVHVDTDELHDENDLLKKVNSKIQVDMYKQAFIAAGFQITNGLGTPVG